MRFVSSSSKSLTEVSEDDTCRPCAELTGRFEPLLVERSVWKHVVPTDT